MAVEVEVPEKIINEYRPESFGPDVKDLNLAQVEALVQRHVKPVHELKPTRHLDVESVPLIPALQRKSWRLRLFERVFGPRTRDGAEIL